MGFMAGWLYTFGLVCFVPMTMAAVAYLTSDLLGLGQVWWFPIFLLGMALLVGLSVIRIAVTSRLQLVVAAITIIVILVVDITVTAKGGAHGNTAAPFTFTAHREGRIFRGLLTESFSASRSYIGFESAATSARKQRTRAAPFRSPSSRRSASPPSSTSGRRASMSIGFGVDNGAAFGEDSFALKTIAARFVGDTLASLVEIGALLSAFFVCVGCATAATRTLFSMGREGALPPWLGRTHSRFQTPANAALTVAAVATVLAALVGFGLGTKDLGGEATTVYYFFATLGTLCVILVYIGLCIGGAVFFRRSVERYCLVRHLMVPAVGVIIFTAALYGSIYPTPPEPLDMTPYITLAAIVLGFLALGLLRVSRPEAVGRIGSILGEEEPTSAVSRAAG